MFPFCITCLFVQVFCPFRCMFRSMGTAQEPPPLPSFQSSLCSTAFNFSLSLQPRIEVSTLHAWLLNNAGVECPLTKSRSILICLSLPLCKREWRQLKREERRGFTQRAIKRCSVWKRGVDTDACFRRLKRSDDSDDTSTGVLQFYQRFLAFLVCLWQLLSLKIKVYQCNGESHQWSFAERSKLHGAWHGKFN